MNLERGCGAIAIDVVGGGLGAGRDHLKLSARALLPSAPVAHMGAAVTVPAASPG